jgi:hypothetical protein
MLKHDLVERDSVIESDLVIRDVSRRNQNFQVASKNGHSYLLKYGGIGKGKTASIPHEAAIYRFLGKWIKQRTTTRKIIHLAANISQISTIMINENTYLFLNSSQRQKTYGNTILAHVGFLVYLLLR